MQRTLAHQILDPTLVVDVSMNVAPTLAFLRPWVPDAALISYEPQHDGSVRVRMRVPSIERAHAWHAASAGPRPSPLVPSMPPSEPWRSEARVTLDESLAEQGIEQVDALVLDSHALACAENVLDEGRALLVLTDPSLAETLGRIGYTLRATRKGVAFFAR